jgi:hypothetical protein
MFSSYKLAHLNVWLLQGWTYCQCMFEQPEKWNLIHLITVEEGLLQTHTCYGKLKLINLPDK